MQINAVDCRTKMATATFLCLRRLAEDSVHIGFIEVCAKQTAG